MKCFLAHDWSTWGQARTYELRVCSRCGRVGTRPLPRELLSFTECVIGAAVLALVIFAFYVVLP